MSEMMNSVMTDAVDVNDRYMKMPIEATKKTLQYLLDVQALSETSRPYEQVGEYQTDENYAVGEASANGAFLELSRGERSTAMGATVKVKNTTYSAGLEDWGWGGPRDMARPRVHIERGPESRFFSERYSKRAAELVFQLANKRVAMVGYEKVEQDVEKARVAQAALARYEEPTVNQ